jgi:hypothetical protein
VVLRAVPAADARMRRPAVNHGAGLPSVPAQLAPGLCVCGQWAATGRRRRKVVGITP